MRKLQGRALVFTVALGSLTGLPLAANAQAVPEPAAAGAAAEPEVAAASAPASAADPAKHEVVPSKAPERQVSLDPKRVEKAPAGRMTFDIDPVADSAMIAVSLGFAGTLELINST